MMASHTAPLLERYAARHGADFSCVNLQLNDAPPSWVKVPYLADALDVYDEVCWVDVDIVVARNDRSIFGDVPAGAWQAVVEHMTECGNVPNCGVWVLRKPMRPVLAEAWSNGLPRYRIHPWWEQAAMIERMGYSVYLVNGNKKSELLAPTELHRQTHFLPPEWNSHPCDSRRPAHPRFIHVTQYADRIGEIRRLCAAAT